MLGSCLPSICIWCTACKNTSFSEGPQTPDPVTIEYEKCNRMWEVISDLAPTRLLYWPSCSARNAIMKSFSPTSLEILMALKISLTTLMTTNLNVWGLPLPTTPWSISAYLILLGGHSHEQAQVKIASESDDGRVKITSETLEGHASAGASVPLVFCPPPLSFLFPVQHSSTKSMFVTHCFSSPLCGFVGIGFTTRDAIMYKKCKILSPAPPSSSLHLRLRAQWQESPLPAFDW